MKTRLLNRLVLLPFVLVMVFLGVVVLLFSRFANEFEQLAADQETLAEASAITLLESGQRRFEEAVGWLTASRAPDGFGAGDAAEKMPVVEALTGRGEYAGAVALDTLGMESARHVAATDTLSSAEGAIQAFQRQVRTGAGIPRSPFFESHEGGFLAFYSIRITEPFPAVWLLAWEFVDSDMLSGRAATPGARFTLRHFAGPEAPPGRGPEWDAVITLANAEGRAVGTLDVTTDFDPLSASSRFLGRQLVVLWVLLIAFLIVFTGAIFVWFGLPLARLNRALADQRPEELTDLAQRENEFGRLADLMLRFFEQQKALREEVEARERVETSLQASEQGLREALLKRERLARDIHDSTIQAIFSLGLRIRRMERFVGPPEEEARTEIKRELTELTEQINRIIADMRNLIAELDPSDIQEQGLEDAAERLAESFRRSTGAEIHLDVRAELCAEIERETQLNLFHITHEAFSNALRHGKATRVSCILSSDTMESLSLEIQDNGSGFDPASAAPGGRGLGNMRQRAREIGADFELDSSPGGPTRIHLSGF